jgi:hypothetical protein
MRRYLLLLAMVAVFALPLIAFAQADSEIALGDTVEGSLSEGNLSARYSLSGNAGDEVTISLESDDFDAYLTLLAPNGDVLITDDDGGGAPNAQIADYALPEAGDYTIVVDSYNRLATGDYTLSVTGTAAEVTSTPTSAPATPTLSANVAEGTELAVGDSVDGSLDQNTSSVAYTFAGQADDIVSITMESNAFDAYLTLLNADGDELATDDDSAGNLNARIENFELPADGTYTIEAGSFSSGASGDFTLTLESGAAVVEPTAEPTEAPTNEVVISGGDQIEVGASVSGTLSGGEAEYTFAGQEGDVVTITLESGDFDAFLILRDAGGSVLDEDDDSAGSLNSRIQGFELPADGTYTIVVSSLGGSGSGSYTLTLDGEASTQPTAAPTTEPTIEPTDEPVASTGDLVYGDSLADTLENGPNLYTFDGEAGDLVTITLVSTDFDAYLRLLDPSGRELTTDDDSGGDLNARIANFELPADGTYTIVASGFDDAASGDYTLTLEVGVVDEPTVVPTEPTDVPEGGDIAIGDTVSGTLGSSLSETYTFAGEAGQVVTITLISEDFDTYLRLYGPNGDELVTDDDGAGNLDSRISLFELPENGLYTIAVETFSGDTGDYTLTLSTATIDTIEYSDSVDGLLEVSGTAGYRFTGEAGDVITITVRSSEFDTYVTLSESAGSYPLAENDDGGDGTNSLIGPFTLPSDGVYIITVRSYSNSSGGRYTLQLNQAELQDIEFDEPVTAVFDDETGALFYSFEGTAGDVISIRVNSGGAIDTSLALTGPDNFQLAYDDDSGPDFDPEINRLILGQDGTYTILLQTFTPGDTGEVTLSLSRAAVRSLDDGSQQIQLNEKILMDVVTFEGRAGETVRLTIDIGSQTNSAPSVNVTQDGTLLATVNASGTSAISLEFTVPEDGTVTVQISDYNFAKVVMEVTLERLEDE